MEQEQLTLNLQIRPALSLDNFAVGDNAELMSVLRTMAETGSGPQFLYLWGETGVGCTHLLHAMDPLAGVERVPAFSESRLIYTVDDVEELGEESQQKLFELMNDVRSHSDGGPFGQYRLITAGDLPPLQMKGRPDVISRLSWGLVFQVHPLTDDARQWMLEHLPRDMGTLSEALFEVERFALGASKKITRTLLRQCFPPRNAAVREESAPKMVTD